MRRAAMMVDRTKTKVTNNNRPGTALVHESSIYRKFKNSFPRWAQARVGRSGQAR